MRKTWPHLVSNAKNKNVSQGQFSRLDSGIKILARDIFVFTPRSWMTDDHEETCLVAATKCETRHAQILYVAFRRSPLFACLLRESEDRDVPCDFDLWRMTASTMLNDSLVFDLTSMKFSIGGNISMIDWYWWLFCSPPYFDYGITWHRDRGFDRAIDAISSVF